MATFSLLGWIVESSKEMGYIDSNHYKVLKGKRSIEIIYEKEGPPQHPSIDQSEINLVSLSINRIKNYCLDEIIDPFLESNKYSWVCTSVHRVVGLALDELRFNRS